MKNHCVSELYYVKLRRIVGGNAKREWLGWLGLGGKEGYSSFRDDENTLPPQDRVLAVQWMTECEDGGQMTADQLSAAPRYLRAFNYPGGARFLGGEAKNGFYCYWHEGDASGGPGENYALDLIPVPDSKEFMLRRRLDNGPVYTYDTYYMAYEKYGSEFEITFEFIPASKFSAKNEHWMADYNAKIGEHTLSEIMIPGSHDAGCSQMSRWGAGMTSQTQGLDIYDQLMAGSRYFDLRAELDSDNIWKIKHGVDWANITLQYVVEQLRMFLDNHPKEIVITSLLLDDQPGVFNNRTKQGWELVFNALHGHHLNFVDQAGHAQDLSQITPNYLTARGKNLLLFSWGASSSWCYTNPEHESIFIAPWASGNGSNMDLNGVFVDDAFATAGDIFGAYQHYQRSPGNCWILHTNTPWQFADALESLYHKHVRNTPQLAHYIESGQIGRPKANIINIDYVGDVVDGNNLVELVIQANR